MDGLKQKMGELMQKFTGHNAKVSENSTSSSKNGSMKVMLKTTATYESLEIAFIRGKVYEVMSIEEGYYRIMTELDDDYLFPPELFDIVDE